MLTISEYVLRAPIRTSEVVTTINVPAGMTSMQFYSPDVLVFARKGEINADVPDSSYVNDGSASFPYPAGQIHTLSVTGGDRFTFVASTETERVLFVAFS